MIRKRGWGKFAPHTPTKVYEISLGIWFNRRTHVKPHRVRVMRAKLAENPIYCLLNNFVCQMFRPAKYAFYLLERTDRKIRYLQIKVTARTRRYVRQNDYVPNSA